MEDYNELYSAFTDDAIECREIEELVDADEKAQVDEWNEFVDSLAAITEPEIQW